MHVIRRVEDHYIVRDDPINDPPTPEDKLLEEPLAPTHQVRHRGPDDLLKSSFVSTYLPRNAFEHFVVASLTQPSDSISRLTSPFQRTEQ